MIPNLPVKTNADLQGLANNLAQLMQELELILTSNISTDNLADDAVTASKINVTTLAQIVADLGTITAGILQNVQITTAFTNISDGATTLSTHLNNKATKTTSTTTNTHDHGIPNGTVLMVNGGGTVTFNSNTHSHTQQ